MQSSPYAYDSPVVLGGVRYLLQARWSWRAADWRLSVQNIQTGEYVATDRRLSPGTPTAILPTGEIHTFGADPYTREALGERLRLIYYTNEELTQLRTDAAGSSDPTFSLIY